MAGIYIHIPFCRQACTYCNFHFSTSLNGKPAVLEAIQKEIGLSADFAGEDNLIETIYFGGGTPSLLTADEMDSILSALRSRFLISNDAEISLEANPDDISPALLEAWLGMGINRLSLGIQSFSEIELRWMNRAHNALQSMQSIRDIIAAGFTNFSADLIYGSPLLSNEALASNASIIFEHKIPHISAYALTVEPKTALYKLIEKKQSLPVDADRQAEQFNLLLDLSAAAGYEQYEISNFAKPGFRSRHNSSYWKGKPYHGFGPAAHSFNGKDIRRWNIANNALYVSSLDNNIIPFEEEILTTTQQLNEYIMTALRTREGISLALITEKYGEAKAMNLLERSNKYREEKLLLETNGYLQLTREGKFLADGIAADLFF
ncbi:MAG: coproporphyrinogen oxidase [Ferruginibacter sp.]|nr:coproporphyrinogen oxidase [Ferruginibacter sp.]